LEACTDDCGGVCNGHGDLRWEPSKGVGDAFFLGGPNVGTVAAVGMEGWSNVPPIDAMGRPGLPNSGLVVDENVDTGGGDGGSIEVIVAIDLSPGGEIGVDAGAA
jgi:hypothetical protein